MDSAMNSLPQMHVCLQADLALETGLIDYPEIHEFLDGFYMSRIGIRILIGVLGLCCQGHMPRA